MSIINELLWRGLIQDTSDSAGIEKLPSGTRFYTGFDPTAQSLQVGNLIPLLVSSHLSRRGLEPIILFGGATGIIGDPGGKSAERNLLEVEKVAANVALQRKQIEDLLPRLGFTTPPLFVNNLDWTKDVSVLSFLRDIGKHFTVNYMIAKDSVKSRLSGEGISYTEFSYMLLQAFDSLHLFQTENCKLQIGGSDQWGNITAGLELIRRKLSQQAYALSFPLVTDSQGKKFGKSEGNAIWLDPHLTSPYKFHQFWLNVQDTDVIRLLKLFTLESQARIEELACTVTSAPEARAAQKALADTVCTLVHGEAATNDAKRCADALFGGTLEGLSSSQLSDLFADAPSSLFTQEQIAGLDFVTLLGQTVAKSKGEARRLLSGGGIYLDNERISDEALQVSDTQLLKRGLIVLRSGKKNYHLVRVQK
jgi:tyrosyl-tRNA synthetase